MEGEPQVWTKDGLRAVSSLVLRPVSVYVPGDRVQCADRLCDAATEEVVWEDGYILDLSVPGFAVSVTPGPPQVWTKDGLRDATDLTRTVTAEYQPDRYTQFRDVYHDRVAGELVKESSSVVLLKGLEMNAIQGTFGG